MNPEHPGSARRAVVLHGLTAADSPPDELDSQREIMAIRAALQGLGYSVEELGLGLNLEPAFARLSVVKPQVVFNLVDTIAGSSQFICLAPLLLERLQLPFTGCGSVAMMQTTDKLLAKELLAAAGIPTPAWIQPLDSPDALLRAGNYPYIVKSVMEDASVGIFSDSVVRDEAELRKIASDRRQRFGGRWFAERYIDGREFNVSVLQHGSRPAVLGVSELYFESFPAELPRILDYTAKWDLDSFVYKNTYSRFTFSPEDEPLLEKVRQLALRCWSLFRLTGYGRVDFRIDAQGNPFVLEVNANPCVSPDAGFIRTAEKNGISYSELVGKIVESALAQSAR